MNDTFLFVFDLCYFLTIDRNYKYLPWKLNEDFRRYSTSGMKLKTNEDLETLKEIAQDRKRWKELTDDIYRAAKAEKNLVY